MNQKTLRTLIYVGAGAAVLYVVSSTARETVAAAANAVNPTSQTNAANRATNSLYQSITGSDGTPGTDLAEWLHE